MLLEDVGECAEPRTTFNDDGAILPICIGRFQEIARAVSFQRTSAGTEADKAERGRLVLLVKGYSRLLASAIGWTVCSRVERLVRVDGSPVKGIATAASATTDARSCGTGN